MKDGREGYGTRLKEKRRLECVVVPIGPDMPWATVWLPLPMSEWEWQQFLTVLDSMKLGFVDERWITTQAEIGPPAPFAYRSRA